MTVQSVQDQCKMCSNIIFTRFLIQLLPLQCLNFTRYMMKYIGSMYENCTYNVVFATLRILTLVPKSLKLFGPKKF